MKPKLGPWHYLCDVVFPPSAAALAVRSASLEDLNDLYKPTYTTDIEYLVSYQEKLVRSLIHEAKFHYNQHAYALLASLIATHLKQEPHTVVPIPLSPQRFRERGYNQCTEILTRAVRQCQTLKINEKILRRNRNTKPQTELSKVERLQNVANAFTVPNRYQSAVVGQNILIIDDVVTTGATLKAAAAAIATYKPASIRLLALAH